MGTSPTSTPIGGTSTFFPGPIDENRNRAKSQCSRSLLAATKARSRFFGRGPECPRVTIARAAARGRGAATAAASRKNVPQVNNQSLRLPTPRPLPYDDSTIPALQSQICYPEQTNSYHLWQPPNRHGLVGRQLRGTGLHVLPIGTCPHPPAPTFARPQTARSLLGAGLFRERNVRPLSGELNIRLRGRLHAIAPLATPSGPARWLLWAANL